jgi:probable rRNA maturation factor
MIDFTFEDISPVDFDQDRLIKWLELIAELEKYSVESISYIFCSDSYLLDINKQYLDHDYFTDIITFDYTEKTFLSGDMFISIDRVKENAITYNVSFLNELYRVIVHGLLHLCGYKDKSDSDATMMRSKEDEALLLF